MHELPITKELLSKVLVRAKENSLKRVNKLYVRLGEFSGYVDESIEFYWNIIAKDTIAAKATFEIERVPGKSKCLSCGYESGEINEKCGKCQSHRLKVVSGADIVLAKIEGE